MPNYEKSDASPRLAAALAGAMAALIAVCCLVGWVILRADRTPSSAVPRDSGFKTGPSEITSIRRDWAAQDAAVRAHLGDYAWSDRRAGIVRIPLDRAIDLMLSEQPPSGRSVKSP